MRQFSVFMAPLYAFFSRALFRDVGSHWRRVSFVYLLLLLAVCWIPVVAGLHLKFSEFLDNTASHIIQQIPAITIKNGRVSTDVDQPYFIHMEQPEQVIAIIDTTGQITSLEGSSAVLLITESQVIERKSDWETRVHNLHEVPQFYLDGPMVQRWLRLFGTWGIPLLYPVGLAGSYIARLVQVLFYSVIGMIIAKGVRCELDYGGILSVAMVAITPAIILKTVFWSTETQLPFAPLVYLAITIGYLAFGLASNRDNSTSDKALLQDGMP